MTATDMPSVATSAGPIHYRVTGPDDSALPPVVFVHGLLVNGELWTQVAERLGAQGYRCYAPDLPLGAHQVALDPEADLTPRGVARLLLEFLAALELTDVTLVGNDTGGALCQFLVDTDAARIGRLVLTNCDAFDQFPPSPFGLLIAVGRRPGRLRAAMAPTRLRALRHSALGFGGLVASPLDPALSRRWIEPVLRDRGVRRDAARFMGAVHKADLLDVSTRLDRFARPVLLLWGDADRFFKLSFAERLRTVFPDARLVLVPGARTFVSLDEPERVADEIGSFCAART